MEGAIPVDGLNFHHEVFATQYGTLLTLDRATVTVENYPTSETDPNAPTATADIVDDPVIEFDPVTGSVLNRWPLTDILDPTRIGYGSIIPSNVGGNDWGHANAVILDPGSNLEDPSDDGIIVSVRHQDAVIKFSRATGNLIWILGPHENWGSDFQPFLLTPVGEPFEWQYHQHAPMITPHGTLLLFDNGNNRASPFDAKLPDANNYSRVVEYSINEQTMEVSQVWEYGSNTPERLYSGFICDADWLSQTGNVLATFGGTTLVNGVPTAGRTARIIEVDPATSTKVFELVIDEPNPIQRGWIVYRSERIADLYPLLTQMSVSLSADQASPAQLATVEDVTFTASAAGGSGSYDYQFWIRDSAGTWTIVQDYGNGDAFVWTPPAADSWIIAVRARNLGSSALYEAVKLLPFHVVDDAPATSVDISADKGSPAQLATVGNVTFTASASGGSGNYDYQFWVRDLAGVWAIVQDYGSDDTFVWTPPTVGGWVIAVRAKNLGSSALFEAVKTLLFNVVDDPPVTSVSLSADKSSPAQLATVGNVTFTASASGGSGNYDYQFWTRDSAGTWTIVQDYGNGDTFVWTPTVADSWIIAVRAKNLGGSALFEAVRTLLFEITP